MSTTFEIYPGKSEIPTYATVIRECLKNYHNHFKLFNIQYEPGIFFKLMKNGSNEILNFDWQSEFKWDENAYLWVTVECNPGGTDGYFWINDKYDYEYWDEDIIMKQNNESMRKYLKQCIAQGHHWVFRRSIGQPTLIYILYGILSGTLASLTDGVVFSDDSAWDYDLMPIRGKEFLEKYR